jgi:hypothetical protein
LALNQNQYRFGENFGTESTHPWLAAANFPIMVPPGRPFLFRGNLQASGGVAHNNSAGVVRYRHTPKATGIAGPLTNLTTTGNVIRTGDSPAFADAANCTKRLGGTGTFEASGAGCTEDGSFGGGPLDIVANGCAEFLIGGQLIGAGTAVGDRIELLAEVNGSPLAGYAAIGEIIVGAVLLDIQARDGSEHVSVPVAGAKVRGAQTMLAVVGLTDTDLADTDLMFHFEVWGATVQGSVDPADYNHRCYGPDTFTCGFTGTKGKYNGMLVKPEFNFSPDVPEDIKRTILKVKTTTADGVTPKTTTGPWGVDGSILGDV